MIESGVVVQPHLRVRTGPLSPSKAPTSAAIQWDAEITGPSPGSDENTETPKSM